MRYNAIRNSDGVLQEYLLATQRVGRDEAPHHADCALEHAHRRVLLGEVNLAEVVSTRIELLLQSHQPHASM